MAKFPKKLKLELIAQEEKLLLSKGYKPKTAKHFAKVHVNLMEMRGTGITFTPRKG